MTDFLGSLSAFLPALWEMSLTAAYAAAVVAVLRLILKHRAPRQVLCLLWLVVFARLLIPVSLESPLSIVPNALPGQEQLQLPVPVPEQNTLPIQEQSPEPAAFSPSQDTALSDTDPVLTIPEGVTPAPPPHEPEPTPIPWEALLSGAWLAGALAMGGYGLVSYARLRRRLFDSIRAKDGAWEHPAAASPFILGVFRPRIYLPAGLAGQPRQFILCHERAHLRRLDHIVKPVCWAALALHWFNPAAWIAFVLMSRDIEAACDEAVLRQLGDGVKADYSDTLLALATGRWAPAPCPLAFGEGDAKGRITNVLRYRRPALWIIVVSVLAALLAAVCLLTDPVDAKAPNTDTPINVPILLDDEAMSVPVPDFLDEEQQLLYRQMYAMYGHLFGTDTEQVCQWEGGDTDWDPLDTVWVDNTPYVRATGRYADWSDFEQAVLSVFTPGFWENRNLWLGECPYFINVDGALYFLQRSNLSEGYNAHFPETFRLVERTDSTISFTMTGYYCNRLPVDFSDREREAHYQAGYDYTKDYAMRLVRTENGWRFDQFYCAKTDNLLAPGQPEDGWLLASTRRREQDAGADYVELRQRGNSLQLDWQGVTYELSDPAHIDSYGRYLINMDCRDYDGDGQSEVLLRYDDANYHTVLAMYERNNDGLTRCTYAPHDLEQEFSDHSVVNYDSGSRRLSVTYTHAEGNLDGPERLISGHCVLPEGFFDGYEALSESRLILWPSPTLIPTSLNCTINFCLADDTMRGVDIISSENASHLLHQTVGQMNFSLSYDGEGFRVKPADTIVMDYPDFAISAPEPTALPARNVRHSLNSAVVEKAGGGYQLNCGDIIYPVDPVVTQDNCADILLADFDNDGETEAAFISWSSYIVLYDLQGDQLVPYHFDAAALRDDFTQCSTVGIDPDGRLTVGYPWGGLLARGRQEIITQAVLPDHFFEGSEALKNGTLRAIAFNSGSGGVSLLSTDSGPRLDVQAYIFLQDDAGTVSRLLGCQHFPVCYTGFGFYVEMPGEIELMI